MVVKINGEEMAEQPKQPMSLPRMAMKFSWYAFAAYALLVVANHATNHFSGQYLLSEHIMKIATYSFQFGSAFLLTMAMFKDLIDLLRAKTKRQ